MDEFILRLVELPSTVNAVTVLDDNGDFNVYVNSRLSDEEQKKTTSTKPILSSNAKRKRRKDDIQRVPFGGVGDREQVENIRDGCFPSVIYQKK